VMTAVPPDRRRQQRDRTRPLGRDIMSQEPWGAATSLEMVYEMATSRSVSI
jgi:hypothetical protein